MKLENVKVLEKGELKSGIGQNGEWRIQSYIVETMGNYPKKYEVEFRNNRIDSCTMQIGEVVSIEVDLDSREYNGRFYYSLKGWKVERGESEAPQALSAEPVAKEIPQAPTIPTMPTAASNTTLPF